MKVTCLREPRRPLSSFQAEEQFSVLSNGDIGRQCKSCFCLTLRLPLVCFIFWQNRFIFISDQVSFSLPPTFYSSKLTVRMRNIFRMSSHLRSYAYYLHYCPESKNYSYVEWNLFPNLKHISIVLFRTLFYNKIIIRMFTHKILKYNRTQ